MKIVPENSVMDRDNAGVIIIISTEHIVSFFSLVAFYQTRLLQPAAAILLEKKTTTEMQRLYLDTILRYFEREC